MPQGRLIPTPGTDNVKNCPTNSRIGGGGGGGWALLESTDRCMHVICLYVW